MFNEKSEQFKNTKVTSELVVEPQEKQIRFIDSHYNLKFYIPDGGKIKITFRDGHTADEREKVCRGL